jgi:hypothetical protein
MTRLRCGNVRAECVTSASLNNRYAAFASPADALGSKTPHAAPNAIAEPIFTALSVLRLSPEETDPNSLLDQSTSRNNIHSSRTFSWLYFP